MLSLYMIFDQKKDKPQDNLWFILLRRKPNSVVVSLTQYHRYVFIWATNYSVAQAALRFRDTTLHTCKDFAVSPHVLQHGLTLNKLRVCIAFALHVSARTSRFTRMGVTHYTSLSK